MCTHCRLQTPRGASELCPACAIDLRVETRRGLEELERHLCGWADFERWLSDQR
ncbi:MAG: hypothetical protein ACM33B_10275 [Pseudomonadota bacterium]